VSAPATHVPIERVEGVQSTCCSDVLAVEEPLEIRLGGISLSITMRTPGDDIELAAGFLFSEGLVRQSSDIGSIGPAADGTPNTVEVELAGPPRERKHAQRNFVTTSACGVCGKSSIEELSFNACPVLAPDEIHVDPAMIHCLPGRLREAQGVFDATGGLHAAARFNLDGQLEAVREDVGRHNALDKLIGAALLDNILPLRASLLLVSGRASFELVQKALLAGFPILAAVGAPSSLAVSTAAPSGMTLLGFLRNGRFNIYSGAQRLTAVSRSE
jgi:FdhD protein